MAYPLLSNLALVEATDAAGTITHGTGYFITADRVLTARHVLGADETASPNRIRLRREEETGEWFEVETSPVWEIDGLDAVVLGLTRPASAVGEVLFGGSPPSEDAQWASTAYPEVASQSSDEPGARDYKTVGLSGTWYPQGGRGQGMRALDLGVNDPPQRWHGISGAPVFVDTRLIGIIDSSPPDFENRRLTATPIELIAADGGFLAATATVRHVVPDGDSWSLVLHAESTSSATKETIASALEQVEAKRKDLNADEQVHVPSVVTEILDELESPGTFLQLVDLVSRAPVMITDVTNFEPAVMMLLGIRAVARRGVTVAVTGLAITEGHLKDLPFNIQESRLISLARADSADAVASSIQAGTQQVQSRADYLDLPAYDAVRCRPPSDMPRGTPAQVLVLCPFADEYDSRWEYLQGLISRKKSRHHAVRMLDIESPRLIGQALYEQIRWNRHCVVDLTWWRPNVLFELGVRLASTVEDPILLIDGRDPDTLRDGTRLDLQQLTRLRQLLRPASYATFGEDPGTATDDAAGAPENAEVDEAFARHASRLRGEELALSMGELPIGSTHLAVAGAYDWTQERLDQLPHEVILSGIASRLGSDSQRRASETQTLFSANEEFAAQLEERTREDWVAAWLYAAVRYGENDAVDAIAVATRDAGGGIDRRELSALGEQVTQALSRSSDPFHENLRDSIIVLIDGWEDE